HVRREGETRGLHHHHAFEPAHPGARHHADRLVLAGSVDRDEGIVGGDALDQRREHIVGDVGDEPHVVVLQGLQKRFGPAHPRTTPDDMPPLFITADAREETTITKMPGGPMLRTLAVAAALALSTLHATAQTYPNRPVTLVVPFPPGGSTTIVARIVADRMAEALGQPIVVDNRGGAGGTIGTRAVAKSIP